VFVIASGEHKSVKSFGPEDEERLPNQVWEPFFAKID